jgi:transcriptional regulator with PAS, ATPase and Fis domain
VDCSVDTLIGASPAINAIRSEMESAARSSAKVMLTGETGVGKDLVARLIHQQSDRRGRRLVVINCASVPDSLLESELFGHVRGSFTGADRDRIGLLEAANHGTVFLDEVCDMSPRMQALLLRFLESGEIQRVGSDRHLSRIDVRVMAATNRDPAELVASRAFREDLYYRLNVIDIRIPPLRARREDIRLLFDHFMARYAERHGVVQPVIAADAMKPIVEYDWPGNVRQLKNIAERLVVRAQAAVVTAAALPPELVGRITPGPAAPLALRPDDRSATDALFDRMVIQRESFWSVVYPSFMTRDLTRTDLQSIVRRGLQQTSGSYKLLVELLNMQPTDYKRFLNFLRKHQCHVPFEPFRAVRKRQIEMPRAGLPTACVAEDANQVAETARRR